MSHLIDTSLLVRSVHSASAQHREALDALSILRGQSAELCIVPQNIVEFWAVATRETKHNGLGMTIETVKQEIVKLKGLFIFKPDTEDVFVEWERIVDRYGVTGKPVHDARLVAAARAHGLTHIVTFNVRDFGRYSDMITVVAPAEVLAANKPII